MVSLVNIVYFLLKMHGLTPFRIQQIGGRTRAVPSMGLTIYCLFYTILVIIIVIYGELYHFMTKFDTREWGMVACIVVSFEFISTSVRTFGIYITQLCMRNVCINLINSVFNFKNIIIELRIQEIPINCNKCIYMKRTKLVTLLLQTAAFLFNVIFKVVRSKNKANISFWIMMISFYKDFFLLIISNLFFFSMMVCWHCLRILNEKLDKNMQTISETCNGKTINHQMICVLCDDIDMISKLLNANYTIIRVINNYFSFQLLLMLTDCFMVSLAQV